MANSVNFNIKLTVNGKEQVVGASVAVEELRQAVDNSKESVQAALSNFNNFGFAMQGIQSAVSQLSSTLNSLTAESRSFGAAMAAANTMAGKSGKDFENLKGQVAELAKEVPVARDALANGLYQVISNGVPEDNWIEFLKTSARSSVGGMAELDDVVKVTSTLIKNYGLSWKDAGAIQDKIQLTAKNGVTTFSEMAAAKAGMIMAAIGQIALSFAQAMTSASKNWITWLAFGIAGTAQLISIISTLSGFNSGEMILNAAQQARLFALANGAAVYGSAAQVGTDFAGGAAGFYIFSWETLRACPSQIPFRNIFGGDSSPASPTTYDITNERVADCDAQLSIPGTYNLLKLTAKTEEMEQVVESPLDSDSYNGSSDTTNKVYGNFAIYAEKGMYGGLRPTYRKITKAQITLTDMELHGGHRLRWQLGLKRAMRY